MTDVAIRVENLSKQYKLGSTIRHDHLKDLLTSGLNGLFRRPRSPVSGPGSSPSSTPPNPKFEIRNSKSDLIWALKDISFEVKKGDVLGFIGANGAGKSTLLKILSRITQPTEGRAEIYGRVGSLLEVGTGFHAELTGRENIYLNAAVLGMPKAEIDRKFDEIVDFSGVEKFIDTPVKRYSSGMYVRLAFAVAAHLEPEILIVDEVLAVGDVAFQKKCLGKMDEVAREGRTVLFVSHNLAAINQLCNRTILLEGGNILQDGDPGSSTRLYLSNLHSEKSDATFNPPASAKVCFQRIWVSTCDGIIASELDVAQPFQINLTIDVRSPIRDIDLGIWVENIQGTRVCSTNLSDSNGGNIVPLDIGQYTYSITLPERFLVPNGYNLIVMAHVPNVEAVDYHRSAVTFKIIETGSHLQKYKEAWRHGCVLIVPPWRVVEFRKPLQTLGKSGRD